MIKRLTASVIFFSVLFAAAFPALAKTSLLTTKGKASWYGEEQHGQKTASGDVFDKQAFTAAHRKLPLGSVVRVTNVSNGRSVLVQVNDRGPFVENRIIDLSYVAANRLGMVRQGVAPVKVDVLAMSDGKSLDPSKAFYVDICRFKRKSNAVRLVKSLEHAGFSEARVVPDATKSRAPWMVSIGPFESFNEAVGVRDALQSSHPESRIIFESAGL